MRYVSTNYTDSGDRDLAESASVSVTAAVLGSLASDGGLYMPAEIPKLPSDFLQRLGNLSFVDLALELSQLFLGADISTGQLQQIVEASFPFEPALRQLSDDGVYVLELFHGPTLAFKDFGARFMAQLVGHFLPTESCTTVLVATSGDTGSAVANAFLGHKRVRVVVLYPKGQVSKLQECQITTLGQNITALEVEGSFDDCQRLVKAAFRDRELQHRVPLTSANSINLARLLAQSFYYFSAYGQLLRLTREPSSNTTLAVAVPSGNFGNLTAGVLAKKLGLPISFFVAATNSNDVVPQYLKTGVYEPRPSVATISNSMDVGDPSNFARLKFLYNSSRDLMAQDIVGLSVDEQETANTMRHCYSQWQYMLDPHGAVALSALRSARSKHHFDLGIFLETAHPAKFVEVVESTVGTPVTIPERLAICLAKPRLAIPLKANYEALKKQLLSLN